MTSRPPAGYVRIGRLGRSFKLSGGVRLHLDNAQLGEDDDQVTDSNHPGVTGSVSGTQLDGLGRLFVVGLGDTRLRGSQRVSGTSVIFLEGVRDRTTARSLVNAEVWADPGDAAPELVEELTAPTLEEELLGLEVRVDTVPVGVVSAAQLGGSNDVVEVKLNTGTSALVPLVAPYVTVTESGIELEDPPPGLLDG